MFKFCKKSNKSKFKNMLIPEEVRLDLVRRREAYDVQINKYFPKGYNESEGLFGPESMHWRIYRMPLLAIGGFRALLLQVAHPAVADGVHQFSDFKNDYIGRAERTFSSMIKIYFGDRNTAIKSAMKLHKMHGMIRGNISLVKNGENIDSKYCASDPDLLLWILATMIDTTIVIYEKIIASLTATEKNNYYQECRQTAMLMGIPEDMWPPDLDAFYHYYNAMLDGNILRVDSKAIELSKAIFNVPLISSYLARSFAAGFLSQRFQSAYKLSFSKQDEIRISWLLRLIRGVFFMIPKPLRYAPPYYQALYRVATRRGERPRLFHAFINQLAKAPLLNRVSL